MGHEKDSIEERDELFDKWEREELDELFARWGSESKEEKARFAWVEVVATRSEHERKHTTAPVTA